MIARRGLGQLALAAIAALSMGAPSAFAETTLERVMQEGSVRIGFTSEVPYAYIDENGNPTGFAIENAKWVLHQMGIDKVEPVDMAWEALIPALQAGRIDMITSGMAVRPDRCQQVIFAEPSDAVGTALMVKAGNPFNIHSYQDIAANSEIRAGGVASSLELGNLQTVGVPDDRITIFPDPNAMLSALRGGRIDVFPLTSITVEMMLRNLGADSGIERVRPMTDLVVDGNPQKFYHAEVFRKEDTDFRDAFNSHLVPFIGTPEQLALLAPFGLTGDEVPPNPPRTTAELCAAP